MASSTKIAKRLGSVIKLKPELYEKYKELHAAVWPEVIIKFSGEKNSINAYANSGAN